MNDAAANGHVDVVQLLHFNRQEICTKEAIDKIAWHREFYYIFFQPTSLSEMEKCYTQQAMVQRGDLNRSSLDLLICPGTSNLGTRARHLQVTKFLHENRSEGCTAAVMDERPRMDTLQWSSPSAASELRVAPQK